MDDAAARNFTYLAYGLSAVWVILFIYVLSLASRESRMRVQIDSLKRMIEDREKR